MMGHHFYNLLSNGSENNNNNSTLCFVNFYKNTDRGIISALETEV